MSSQRYACPFHSCMPYSRPKKLYNYVCKDEATNEMYTTAVCKKEDDEKYKDSEEVETYAFHMAYTNSYCCNASNWQNCFIAKYFNRNYK